MQSAMDGFCTFTTNWSRDNQQNEDKGKNSKTIRKVGKLRLIDKWQNLQKI